MSVTPAIQCCCFSKHQSSKSEIKSNQNHLLNSDQLSIHSHKNNSNSNSPFPSSFNQSQNAHQVFDGIPQSDTFAWNSLIRHHLTSHSPLDAIAVYHQMLLRGVFADKYTFPPVLTASLHFDASFYGKLIHAHAVKLGFAGDNYVATALMMVYGRFEGAQDAHRVFDKMPTKVPVAWTLLSQLYIAEDNPDLALDVINQMVSSGAMVDSVVVVTAIEACGLKKSIRLLREVHELARKNGLGLDNLVCNSLLKVYLQCGSIDDAWAVFNQMPVKDAVSWTTFVSKYVQEGSFNQGMKLFWEMIHQGIRPGPFGVTSVLPACARISACKHGKQIHGYAIRSAIDLSIAVQNALMDMYVKAGCIDYAFKIFVMMMEKDVVSWTVMILGCSLHGQGALGVELFHMMEQQPGIAPDQEAYAAVLHACNTACMVENGENYFKLIIAPRSEHYALAVRLLSCAGLFDEAHAFIEDNRIGRCVEVLRAMLTGCRVHRNVKIGKRIVEKLLEVDSLNAENYVMLSNVYATSEKWDKVTALREMIVDMGLETKKAYSWIEVRNKIHAFEVGDFSHPRSQDIYDKMKALMKMMKKKGLVPDVDFALHDVDMETENNLFAHCELLAIAFGLISTVGIPIRVTKNLRVCRNCHASLKMISKIVNREIVLKDPTCYHHFKNGSCSCQDNW